MLLTFFLNALDKVICHISYGHTNLIHIQLKIHMPMQHSALQQDILPNGSYAISIFFIKLFAILSMVTLISFIHIQQRHISMQYSDTNNIRCIGQYCVMHICCDTFPMCESNWISKWSNELHRCKHKSFWVVLP